MPCALQVVSGEREGDTFPLPETHAVTIGRDPTNDFRLMDRKLSRIHCQFQIIGGRCQITDLNSTNGTVVNGRRIEAEEWLNAGDTIEVGTSQLRLIQTAKAEPVPDTRTPSQPMIPIVNGPERCEECGRPIPADDILAGRVRKAGARTYCLSCSASVMETATPQAPTAEPLSTTIMERGQPGKEIAGVRIISLIGQGRLGPLYKGEQLSMGRLVALKMLNVAERDWAQKYLQAVYNSGQLVHSNVVLIFDTGEENGVYYVVREYVEGQSAQERLANHEPVPLPEAIGIVTQVAHALDHAAERHIFHGNLSPRKVLLGPKDAVKVTGFGLPQPPPPGRSAASYLWHALVYSAPERLRTETQPDARSDVYSAAAIFYHLLTGHAPFRGSTREKIEQRIINTPPKPLAEHLPRVSEATQKIIDRGLSKDPRTRYQQARELIFDLEEALKHEA